MTVYIPNGLNNELTGVAQALRISKATIVRTLLERFIVERANDNELQHKTAAESSVSPEHSERRIIVGLCQDIPTSISAPSFIDNIAFGDEQIRRLLGALAKSPDEIYRMTPEQFEDLILNRLVAMGHEVKRTGSTRAPDGGVDLVFWPKNRGSIPFLGAIQAKHHSGPRLKTGAQAVREFQGVLRRHTNFNMGLIVTNTSFTEEAQWFVPENQLFLRLRNQTDLQRWANDDFEGEWQEFPSMLQLTRSSRLHLDKERPT